MIVFAGYRVVTVESDHVSMSDCMTEVAPADSYDYEWFFDDRGAAEQACVPGSRLLAVGFPRQDVAALLEDLARDDTMASAGMPDRLRAGAPMPAGEVLGYELVGCDVGTWHTWTCLEGLVDDVGAATGIRQGRHGLIEDLDQARAAAAWLTESRLGDPKVEIWAAAQLVG